LTGQDAQPPLGSQGAQQPTLSTLVADLQEQAVLARVRRRIDAGDDPLRIMEECGEGMRMVGQRYERQEYYISGLIMAGEIFREVMDLLQPLVRERISGQASGIVLLGTVQGDIHDMGKHILSMLLSCYGFTVHDLGVDVPPETFVVQSARLAPDIVGLSGLLTASYDSMRETASRLRDATRPGAPSVPIIIGGGMMNQKVCDYVGADDWAEDAMAGVRLCQRLVEAD
jgi:methanogenic corrinoid protein MtbC1